MDCVEHTALAKEELLTLLNRVSAAASRHSSGLERHLSALEGLSSPRARPSLGGSTAPLGNLTPDTSFGTATVGTSSVELTMNSLLSMVKTLEAWIQSISDHSRSTGVVFRRLAFVSETEFGYWLLQHNPMGDGPAAFIDMVSIWAFAYSESGATE